MSVHYKFKSTLDYDTITFDGLHISVADLKKAILQQKRLSKITDFDLQIINAQTKEEYQHDNSLIPKNTSLIISRVPLTQQAKKTWDTVAKPAPTRITSKAEGSGLDLSKMEGSEEDKIQAMMMQSTADYDPKSYQKIRGFSQTGDVPLTYRCNKCKKGGHWIKNCPYNISKEHTEVKRTTGIPKSFRDNDGRPIVFENQEPIMEEEKKQEIPEDLICSICHDLFVDAVMIPCCGSSFCDDCVRIALLESEDNECPDCKEKGTSPGSLIPNRFLRNSVNNFKNRTGYKPSNNERKGLQAPPAEVTNENKESDKEKEKEKENDIETETEKQIEKDNNETEDATEKETLKHDPPAEIETKPKQLPTEQPAAEEEPQSPKKDKEQHSTENSPVKIEKDAVEIKTEKPDNIVTSPIHDDSDYEDNIVVTVPSASETRTEKFLSRSRHSSGVRPSAIEQSSPKGKHSSQPQQISSYHQENNNHAPSESSSTHHSNRDWDKSHRDKPREHLEKSDHYMYEQKSSRSTALTSNPIENLQPPGGNNNPPVSTGPPMYPPMHTQSYDMPPRLIRPPMNMHPGFHNQMHRPPMYATHPNMPPHHHPAAGAHPQRMPNMNSPYDPAYNQMGNVAMGYPRFPPTNMPPNRFNYPMRESENHPNQMRPYNDIASVYEEVAAKVGVGIIDDPLEAFNRIMKEKEKKKDERRSPERRRRSKDRHISRGTFRSSPFNNRNPKDHGGGGYHDKRARSRDRNDDRGGKWRHGKEDRHWADRDRERDRERERDKEQGYRPRRSKSLERFSRSRSRSPNNNKRYRSPHPVNKPYGTNEKHHHNYYHHQGKPSRIEEYEEQSNINRNNRESNRNYVSLEPAKHMNEHLERRPTESRDMFSHPRRLYNMNDENSEPPPPGFEIPASRNPFHANNIVASPPPPLPVQIHGSSNNSNSNANNSNNNNNRGIRNNTPDLYEKCVSQDLEDNKIYKPANKREQQKAEKKSRTRSRSRSKSSIKFEEKRRRLHRSTTPKGKPSDYHGSSSSSKRDKDKSSSSTAHSHAHAHAASEKYSKNDDSHKSSSSSSHKTSKDHHAHSADIQKSRRRSMTPPRETDESFNESLKAYKNAASDTQHTPEAMQKKDKSLDESGKKEKKLKERKKKRKDKKESKKLKKEKKSKKERHRNKSEEKQKAVFIEDERQHYNSHDDNADNCIEVVELPEDDQNSHHSVVVLVDDKSNDLIKNATPQRNNNEDDDDDDVIFKAVDDDDEDDDDGGMTPKHQQVIIDDDHQTPPSEIKCFDAVLDIHEYETDFDDHSFKLQDNNNAKLVPEASKWEIEEQSGTSAYINDDDDLAEVEENSMGSSVQEVKVTNDVIVRAEKAIFARAINAIRPIELHTKKSSSKDKSYSVDDVSDAGGNMKNIQITLPVTIGSSSSSNINKERRRSIELRLAGESSGERKKSIKERLGSKIDQEQQQQVELHRREERYNRAKSPKQTTDNSRDGERYQRAESKKSDRNYRERDAEKTTAASRDKREKNEGSSGKTKEKERERERERAREREREKEKERVRKRERDSEPEDRNSRRFSKNRDSKIKSDRGHHHHHHQQQQHSNEKKHSPIRHKRDPSSSSTSSWNTESESEERKRRQEKAERKAAAAAHKRSESTESDSKKSSKKKSKSDKKKRKKSKK